LFYRKGLFYRRDKMKKERRKREERFIRKRKRRERFIRKRTVLF